MSKNVRIEYTIRPDVDLDEVKREIAEFVAGIRDHDGAHLYTSYQLVDEPTRFVHIGELDDGSVAALQQQPFFARFAGFLRERCAAGPTVTTLARVASTR